MTRIGVQAAAGRARLAMQGGPIEPRLLRVDENGARIGLVATTALLLGGDHIEIDIDVGPGSWLEIVETAGTVAYDADGVRSSWSVRIRIDAGGALTWAGEPFVVAHGANVVRRTSIDLGGHAVACLRDTVVLGRTGEVGGGVRSTLSVRQQGRTVLLEDLDLTDSDTVHRQRPGMLGTARVIDTVCLLGAVAPTEPTLPAGHRFDLDGPGTLARSVTSSLADSRLASVAARWASAAIARTTVPATIL